MTQTSKTETVYLPKTGRKVEVPVDSEGYVKINYLRKMQGNPKSASNDFDKPHSVCLPSKLTPRQAAAWLEDPGSCDIEGIDVIGKPQKANVKDPARAYQNNVEIYTPDEKEAQMIRKTLDAQTGPADRKALGKENGPVKIVVRPLPPDRRGDTDARNLIRLDTQEGVNGDVIAHEMSHMVRYRGDRDLGKEKKTVSVDKGWGKWGKETEATVEESLTVAEQLVRADKPVMNEGYYQYVRVKDPKTGKMRAPTEDEMKKMCKEDRMTLSGGRQLTGREAVEAVNQNWAKTHIARMKMGGKMAINGVAEYDPSVKPVKAESKPRKKKPKQYVSPEGMTWESEEEYLGYREAMDYAQESSHEELVDQIMSEYSTQQIVDKLKQYSGGDMGETAAVYMNKKHAARKLAEYLEYANGLTEDPSMRRGYLEDKRPRRTAKKTSTRADVRPTSRSRKRSAAPKTKRSVTAPKKKTQQTASPRMWKSSKKQQSTAPRMWKSQKKKTAAPKKQTKSSGVMSKLRRRK